MVDFGDQREPVVGQAVDHVQLPQRPAAVEVAGLDPGGQLAQLGVAARRRQDAVPHVVADVEVGVVDPDRVGETAGHPAQLLPGPRHRADPVADLLYQPRVVPGATGGDGEGGHRTDVHGGGRRLQVQKRRVQRAEAIIHRQVLRSSRAWATRSPVRAASAAPRAVQGRAAGPTSGAATAGSSTQRVAAAGQPGSAGLHAPLALGVDPLHSDRVIDSVGVVADIGRVEHLEPNLRPLLPRAGLCLAVCSTPIICSAAKQSIPSARQWSPCAP